MKTREKLKSLSVRKQDKGVHISSPEKKKSFGIKTFIINCITPGWQFSFSLFEILLGLSKHCNTYAKALCLYTCTPNTKETASLDIKEKTTYNQCLCILDGRYIYLKSLPWFVWPKTCLSCILNDILWLPNNLFSLIIILNPSHTVGFIKFVSMLYDDLLLNQKILSTST